jgi:lactate dehydrogenase-like 2-hydroxyacid dehydrogenase
MSSSTAAAAALTRIIVTRRLPASVLRPLYARPSTQVILHDSDEPMPEPLLRDAVASAAAAPGSPALGIVCLLSDKIDRQLIESAQGRLKCVATMSVGYSHIDTEAAKANGVRLGYTPGVLTDATADLTLALTLATCRRIVEASNAVRTGEWSSWKPFWMTGKDLANATVGIVGMGRIGEAIARRLTGFGCKLLYTSRSGPKPDVDARLGASWVAMDDLLAASDVVIAICSLTPETRGLISEAALRKMKPDAVFINASRGEVVDQDALARVLAERPQFRAGLDVTTPEPLPTTSPLLSLPNCLVLPHIGSASEACRMKMAEMTVANVIGGVWGEGEMPAEVKL